MDIEKAKQLGYKVICQKFTYREYYESTVFLGFQPTVWGEETPDMYLATLYGPYMFELDNVWVGEEYNDLDKCLERFMLDRE